MSAPLDEIWEDDTFSGAWSDCDQGEGWTRYLRADLTCGECYHIWQDTEDGDHWECDEYGERRKLSRPACMAFTPKDQRNGN